MDTKIERREFLVRSALMTGAVFTCGGTVYGADLKGYGRVDPALYRGINRIQDEGKKTPMELKHAPVIEAPEKVKAGEPFEIRLSVGETLHVMSPEHYIEYVEVYFGNEPAGRVEFSPTFGVPKATLTLTLDRPVTIVARQYCNLHGLWESRKDIGPA